MTNYINNKKQMIMVCIFVSFILATISFADYTWDISSGNVFGWTLQRGGGFAVGYNQAGSGSEVVWGPLAAYLPDGATYPAIYDTSATPTSGTYTVSVTGQLTSTHPDCIVGALLHNTTESQDYLFVEIRGWDVGGVSLPANSATVGLLALQPMSSWNYVIIKTATFTDFAYDSDLTITATVDVDAKTATITVERAGGSGAQTLWNNEDISAYTALSTSGKTGIYTSVPGFATPQWTGYKQATGPGTQFSLPSVGYFTDDFQDGNDVGWSYTGGTWSIQADYPSSGNYVLNFDTGGDEFAYYQGASTPASGKYYVTAIAYFKTTSGVALGLSPYYLDPDNRIVVVYLAGGGARIECKDGGVLTTSAPFSGNPVLPVDLPQTFYVEVDPAANTVLAKVDGLVLGPWTPTLDLSSGGAGDAGAGFQGSGISAFDDILLPGSEVLPPASTAIWSLYN